MTRILENKRIFLIEDDILNVGVFSTNLSKNGALVMQDVFGHGIVEHVLQNLPIDLIVLDIMLRRGISGYDVFDAIRNTPQLRNIPIVAATSLDPETEIPKAQAKGFDGFVSKPINVREFPQTLARVINGEKMWVANR